MYRIKRKYSSRKQLWLINLLFLMDPKIFMQCESKETCKQKLAAIQKVIEDSCLKWHRGAFNLHYLRKMQISEDKITITTRGGKLSFSFIIEEY